MNTLKKNWYYFAPAVLLVIPALIMLYYIVSFGYTPGDAWKALRHFGASHTRYAQKYSEDHFNRILPGMGGRDVFELVGVPFERRDKDALWFYSFPQGDTPYYHERVVVFERNAKNEPIVKSLIKRFHDPEVKQ